MESKQTQLDLPEFLAGIVGEAIAERDKANQRIGGVIGLYLKAQNISGNWSVSSDGRHLVPVPIEGKSDNQPLEDGENK